MVRFLSKLISKSPKKDQSDVDLRPSTSETEHQTGYFGERSSAGARHGWGRFVFQSGDLYEGEWRSNQKWGYGDASYCSGSRYRGDWRADAKHGRGIFIFGHDGSSYTGDWLEDKKSGYGVAIFRTGNRYAGQWEGDAMHGTGRFVYSSGDAYEGQWARNRKTGFGTWTSADGSSTYEGAWRDDLRDGAGFLLDSDRIVYEVDYRAGELIMKTPAPSTTRPPAPVDRTPPEPPLIPIHPRSPVPALSPAGPFERPPAGPFERPRDSQSLTKASAADLASTSNDATSTTNTGSEDDAAVLSRLRAWLPSAAPPLPPPAGAPEIPSEYAHRKHSEPTESLWGSGRPSSSGSDSERSRQSSIRRPAASAVSSLDMQIEDLEVDAKGRRTRATPWHAKPQSPSWSCRANPSTPLAVTPSSSFRAPTAFSEDLPV